MTIKCNIDGEELRLKVVENLGFVHSRGCYAKVVEFNREEVVVIKQLGKWVKPKPILLK